MLRSDVKDILNAILMFFDAFLKSLGVRRAPLKTQKKKEKRKAGGRGGAAPRENFDF